MKNSKFQLSHNACYAVYYPRLGRYLSRGRRLVSVYHARLFDTIKAAEHFASTDIALGLAVVEEV